MKNDTQDIIETLKKKKKIEFKLTIFTAVLSLISAILFFFTFKNQIDQLLISYEIKTFNIIRVFILGFCFCFFAGLGFLLSVTIYRLRYECTGENLTIILFEKIKEIEDKINNESNQSDGIGEEASSHLSKKEDK